MAAVQANRGNLLFLKFLKAMLSTHPNTAMRHYRTAVSLTGAAIWQSMRFSGNIRNMQHTC